MEKTDRSSVLKCVICTAAAIPLGVVIGAIDTVFGKGLLWISQFRSDHIFWLVPFLAFAGVLIVWSYGRFGEGTAGGMGLVFSAGHGELDVIPLRLVPFVIVSTWLTHLFGGSAGREGVAVQIGATLSHWVGRRLPYEEAPRILLISGIAAGFSGLFRTPIAAVLFAMEVLTAGRLAWTALVPAMAASFAACGTSQLLGLEKFTFALSGEASLSVLLFGKLVLLGLVFGLVGGVFTRLLHGVKSYFAKRMKNPLLRVLAVGALLSVILLLLHRGRYCGLGTNLISDSLSGNAVYGYDWLCKLVLTVVTLAAGFQGGEVTPLFSIGASLGAVIASFAGMPIALSAALGYAAVFGSATNTLLAPVLIGGEVFGFAYLPYFFIVCAVAYAVNGDRSIYALQKVER